VGQQDDEDGRDRVPDLLSGQQREVFRVITELAMSDAEQDGLLNICLQLDGAFYPSRDWRDRAVVIVRWWIDAFVTLSEGESVRNYFMNGPFSFTTTLSGAILKLEFVQTRLHSEDVLVRSMVSASDYRSALSVTASDLLDKFNATDPGPDLKRLRRSLESLID
jgi:hypothetical protein